MKNENKMIPKLYDALTAELDRREPYLKLRTLSDGDKQRQGFALTNARYFITVLDDHILEGTTSVIFTIELAEDCCTLRFYRPVTLKEHVRLEASCYTPVLRSKVYLTVGLGQSGGVLFACSSVKLSQYSSVIEMFDALFLLGKELDKYLDWRPETTWN